MGGEDRLAREDEGTPTLAFFLNGKKKEDLEASHSKSNGTLTRKPAFEGGEQWLVALSIPCSRYITNYRAIQPISLQLKMLSYIRSTIGPYCSIMSTNDGVWWEPVTRYTITIMYFYVSYIEGAFNISDYGSSWNHAANLCFGKYNGSRFIY